MRRQRNDAGFTLLEVGIAMAATAVLSMGVMLAFSTSGAQDRASYETTRNQNVCVAMMEQIEAMSFDGLQLLSGQYLVFPVDRWLFTVWIQQVTVDLISIETTVMIPGEASQTIRVTTLRARKQEV